MFIPLPNSAGVFSGVIGGIFGWAVESVPVKRI
jgi:hypothetical protein